MGKFQEKLRKRLQKSRKSEMRDRGTFAHSTETEAYKILHQLYDYVSQYCGSREPFMQLVHHLAGIMDLWGPHADEALSSYTAVCENVPGAGDLYGDFFTELWRETGARIKHGAPLIDPIGDLYMEHGSQSQREGFGQYFTPMAVVRMTNEIAMMGTPKIDVSRMRADAELGIYMPKDLPIITPENRVATSDPTCGSGRFGIDAVAYYPTVMMWNAELDLMVYRMAITNARILLNITSGRFTLADGQEAFMIMGRTNHMWCNSLVVNLMDPRNWNKNNNLWDPLDWRTELYAMGDKTFSEMERDMGENHAYDAAAERTAKQRSEQKTGQGIFHEGPPINAPQGTVVTDSVLEQHRMANEAFMREQVESALAMPTMSEVLAFGQTPVFLRLSAKEEAEQRLLTDRKR